MVHRSSPNYQTYTFTLSWYGRADEEVHIEAEDYETAEEAAQEIRHRQREQPCVLTYEDHTV